MLRPATERRATEGARLMVLRGSSASEPILHTRVDALAEFLDRGDLLVVNRSGTVPASLRCRLSGPGDEVELRLASFLGPSTDKLENWYGILFGGGDWTNPTEQRGLPPRVNEGDRLTFRGRTDLSATVVRVDDQFPRLVQVTFESRNIIRELHRNGRPLQYSYLHHELSVQEQQTIFAGPAVSVEPPSAAFALTWHQVLQLSRRGIELASLTHAAGISSTGDAALDRRLPLPEWFDLPGSTARAIRDAREEGRRVVALGTTVVRAIESSTHAGVVVPRSGVTRLTIGPDRPPRIVDALITGMHDEGTSHLELMQAFCDKAVIERGYAEAEKLGYLNHEYGDVSLVM